MCSFLEYFIFFVNLSFNKQCSFLYKIVSSLQCCIITLSSRLFIHHRGPSFVILDFDPVSSSPSSSRSLFVIPAPHLSSRIIVCHPGLRSGIQLLRHSDSSFVIPDSDPGSSPPSSSRTPIRDPVKNAFHFISKLFRFFWAPHRVRGDGRICVVTVDCAW